MNEFNQFLKENKPFSDFIIPFISAAILLLSLFLLAKTAGEIVNIWQIKKAPASNVISVEGVGEVTAIPDVAQFSFTVTKENKVVADAQKAVEEKIDAIVSYLKDSGVEEKDIKTLSYNVYPKYDYEVACMAIGCPPSRQVQTGFEVSQTISVKVIESDKAGEILAGVGEKGADSVSGLSFTVEDTDVLRQEARAEAIENAKAKAGAIASSLGVDLVKVVSFYENIDPYYPAYGMGGGMEFSSVKAMDSVSLPTGENTYISRVSVSFEIR